MRVFTPLDSDFEFERCKKMYEFYRERVNDDATFEEVIENTLFYSFYDEHELVLCVYFYEKEGRLWVNGYGVKKKHLFNKKCFKEALTWFNCDVWADTKYKEVAWALLQCGFKKCDENIYCYNQ